jgi:putative transposase
MCKTLGVTTSGFYAWQSRAPSEHRRADLLLGDRIEAIFKSSRSTYGRPRIQAELRDAGIAISNRRAARLMRERNIYGASRCKWTITTVRNPHARPAPDLVDRKFIAERPDQLWVADITYIPTWSGFLYLAVVLDACSRRVVGWAMANHL